MIKIDRLFMFIIGLVLGFFSCKPKPNCPYQPPQCAAFPDSVYRAYPLFNEMLAQNTLIKRYYSTQDTISVTFVKNNVLFFNGNTDSDGCYSSTNESAIIGIYLPSNVGLGAVAIGSEREIGGYVSENEFVGFPTNDTTINGVNYTGCFKLDNYYNAAGINVPAEYSNSLLLANTHSGLFFINLLPYNKKYYLLP